MPERPAGLGTQWLVNLEGCEPERLRSVASVGADLRAAAAAIGAHVLSGHFHQFEPHGVSGVLVISESHFAVHTWPEHGYAALDLFTCGPHRLDPAAAIALLTDCWAATNHTLQQITRGPDST